MVCRNCGEFQHVNHRCYIEPIREKKQQQQTLEVEEEEEDLLEESLAEDDNENNDKKGPPPKPLPVFADIECSLDADRVFTPNLICWSDEDEDEIHHTESMTDFLEVLEDLTHVEDDERERKVITFFHNLRGFDGNFILETLFDQGRAVERPLTQGAKILYFETGDLVFKDSLNFFAMPLERFPATFHYFHYFHYFIRLFSSCF